MPRALDAVNANCDSNSRRDGLQVPDLCDPDCAAAYLPVFHGCHDLLQSIALQQGQGNERRGAKYMRKFDQLGAACEEAVQNAHQVDEVRVNGATYLITDEQQLEASTELQQIAIPLDYDLGFVLTPGETTVEGWANIIHVTASGNNCCDYGDRIPGICKCCFKALRCAFFPQEAAAQGFIPTPGVCTSAMAAPTTATKAATRRRSWRPACQWR